MRAPAKAKLPRRRWCITPPRRRDTNLRKGETYAAFLTRSTMPVARRIRRFVNGNIAQMPAQARPGLCRGIMSARFHQTNLELILGRTLQELGAIDLEYELKQPNGKRPDYLATFVDGKIFTDARHPDWNADLELRHKANERLIDVIEKEIPPGWSLMASRLPRINLSDRLSPFRAVVRKAFSSLPAPTPRLRHSVSGSYLGEPFELELQSPRLSDRQAWLAGPFSAGYSGPERQIQAAIKDKREQLRGLPHPAILALGGSLGADDDDYEIALFGRSFERHDFNNRVVERGFDRTGVFAKAGSGAAPQIAAVLAYIGMDVTAGRDPILFLHPRFIGLLPKALLRLEVRTLGAKGPQRRPASVHGVFDRISVSAAGR